MEVLFLFLLFMAAVLYAMVGHGGASGYLAIMAIFGMASAEVRIPVLLLNMLVSLVSFYQFQRSGHMRWKMFLWLVAGSVPAAFLGGTMVLPDAIYKKLLGVLLLVPAFRFAGWEIKTGAERVLQPGALVALGVGIGLLSGTIGIGGGILLTPLLLFLGAATLKETAAISALFITLNSAAGLAGNTFLGWSPRPEWWWWVAVTFAGGMLGAWAGARKLTPPVLKRVLSLVLAIASLKLIFT